jgi:hypothetical protein
MTDDHVFLFCQACEDENKGQYENDWFCWMFGGGENCVNKYK